MNTFQVNSDGDLEQTNTPAVVLAHQARYVVRIGDNGKLRKAEVTCSMCGGTDHTERERTDDGEWDEDCRYHAFFDGDGNDRRRAR